MGMPSDERCKRGWTLVGWMDFAQAVLKVHTGSTGSIWACIATADAGLHSLHGQPLPSGELQVEVKPIKQAPWEGATPQVTTTLKHELHISHC